VFVIVTTPSPSAAAATLPTTVCATVPLKPSVAIPTVAAVASFKVKLSAVAAAPDRVKVEEEPPVAVLQFLVQLVMQ